MTTLLQLKPGSRFRLADPQLPITGTLEMANECRARVRLDRAAVDVEFIGSDGEPRQFRAARGHITSWSPSTPVVPLDADGNGPDMPPSIMGYPVPTVIRWCGQQGWSQIEARAALRELKADLTGCDVRTELLAGMRGAACARLTTKQAKRMEDLL